MGSAMLRYRESCLVVYILISAFPYVIPYVFGYICTLVYVSKGNIFARLPVDVLPRHLIGTIRSIMTLSSLYLSEGPASAYDYDSISDRKMATYSITPSQKVIERCQILNPELEGSI